MLSSVQALLAEHVSLQEQLSDASIHANPALAKKLNRRYAELNAIVNAYNQVNELASDLEAAREMAKEDEEFAAEIPATEQKLHEANEKLRRLLIPRDPDDGRDVIMEIKAGEGGAESALCTFNTPTQRDGRLKSLIKTSQTWAAIKTFRSPSKAILLTRLKAFGRT